MTLAEIIYECGELGRSGGTGQRVLSDWKGFINRAQRQIADRANFTFLHDRRAVVITSGSTSVALGANFKELSGEQSPVSFAVGGYNAPVIVTSRERTEILGLWPSPNVPYAPPLPGGHMPLQVVFLETNGPGGQWALNVPPQYSVTSDATFNVSAYWYPGDLTQGEDHNALTDHGILSEALVNLAKSIAYRAEEPDNPKGVAAKQIAEEAIREALYSDGAKRFAGRTMRM